MLVSYNWLKEYVDLGQVTPEELAEKITKAGIEVEHVHELGEGIKNVVVGYVASCEQHPNADKLNLCQIDLGSETVQIVCGAPNIAKGQKVAVAKAGARLPGNIKIKKSKLRGEVSNGMVCSLSELGVESKLVPKQFADGIYVLEDDAAIGDDACPYMNLDDHVLELDILPSSAHCLNMIGVAYEVAAILDCDVKLPHVMVNEIPKLAESKISITIVANDAVPYYGARVIKNINVRPSPQWLQNRLIAAGVRPISNIVDISNYVMLEYGQPLHAFDYDTFGSDQVLVRYANEGEKITTLDDAERTLTSSDVVITNGEKPVAVAGVMGGANSEVSSETKTILLEAAIFEGLTVRRTASRLQMRTDASARYEKGIDRNRVAEAANRAAELIQTLTGGEVLEGIVEEGERMVSPQVITMPWRKINEILGSSLDVKEVLAILSRLHFQAECHEDILHVSVPARRPDVTIPEDLVEEVGRIYGYDNVPATLPEGVASQGALTPYQKQRRLIQRYFEGCGLLQAVTYSLTTEKKAAELTILPKTNENIMTLAMPMSEERSTLRMSLVPGLIEVAQYHLNRQMSDVKLYEIGKVFESGKEASDLPNEREHVAGLFTGARDEKIWEGQPPTVDFFTVKGVLKGLFDQVGLSNQISFKQSSRSSMHPGRTADIFYHDRVIGYAGQIHPSVQKSNDLNDTYVFEVDLQTLITEDVEDITYISLPRYPSTTRDIALVVDEGVKAGDLYQVILVEGGSLLGDVKLFDVYEGEHLEQGKKSLAFSLKYLDPNRTLTDKEVDKTHEKILEACKETFGAVLRG